MSESVLESNLYGDYFPPPPLNWLNNNLEQEEHSYQSNQDLDR